MPAKLRLRHAIALPVLFTGLLITMNVTTPATAFEPVAHTVPLKIQPAVTMKLKPSGWVLPVSGYHLTGRFGNVSSLWAHAHTGLDFAAPTGTPIRSIAPGVVIEVGWAGAYGQRTIVRLADGTELWYCHQNQVAATVGQRVKAGQLIGYVGSTGNTTGPHLHLEVRPTPDVPVDPFAALVAKGLHP